MFEQAGTTQRELFGFPGRAQEARQAAETRTGFRLHEPFLSGAGLLAAFVETMVDTIYPPHCLACGISCGRSDLHLCGACDAGLERITSNTCTKCGHQLAESFHSGPRCRACGGRALFFARAVAPCRYEGNAREMILSLKLGKRQMFAQPLSRLLIDRLDETGLARQADAVVPVPLHWARGLRRGFNQSAMIARNVARHLHLPLLDTLRRTNAVASQTFVSARKRMEQLRGAFRVEGPGAVSGKTLLLIDDVMTTGATAAECSRVLIDAGAKEVFVGVVARTMLTPGPTRFISPT